MEQTINPVFSPVKSATPFKFDLFSPLRGGSWAAEFDSPFAPSPTDTPLAFRKSPEETPVQTGISPIRFSVTKASSANETKGSPGVSKIPVESRVRYSFEDMLSLMETPLVDEEIRLPDSLAWLDKRVDLGVIVSGSHRQDGGFPLLVCRRFTFCVCGVCGRIPLWNQHPNCPSSQRFFF